MEFTINFPSPWAPQVFKVKWYMCHYGAQSAKPEIGFCNNRWCSLLDKGKLDRLHFQGKTKVETVRKTISKRTGKASYSGTPALKASQSLNLFGVHVVWTYIYIIIYITCACMHYMLVSVNLIWVSPAQELSSTIWPSNPDPFSQVDFRGWGVPWNQWCSTSLLCVWKCTFLDLGWGSPSACPTISSWQ